MLATDDSSRPGYRGKCLYKTGKCNNERALKTSGQAHNLCDEHRHRQNEHQRKLDAKNRYARKDKADGKDASPTNMGSNGGSAQRNNRYMPYGKVRMSPGGGTGGAGVTMTDDMHAMLSRGLVPPNLMQFHAMADGVSPAASATASQMVGMSMASGAPQDIVPNGVVILPNGPQAPQMPYQMAMQDFDGIVVPLPSYLEGHERLEFRSRIFQKVMDFIAEECMRRFGAPPTAMAKAHDAPTTRDTPHEAVASNGDDASNKSRPRTGETTDSDGSSSSNNNTNDKKSPAHDDEIKDADDAAGEVGDADNSTRNKRASRGRLVRKDV